MQAELQLLEVTHIQGDLRAGGGDGWIIPLALDGDALSLDLVDQAVQVVQRLVVKGPSGEVGLLDALELPLDGNDGREIPQGDGNPVHIADLAEVRGRIGEQGLDLVQGVLHPVQLHGLVRDQVAVLIQQAVLLQQGLDRLAILAGEVLQLRQQRLVCLWAVSQQIAQGGVGRGRQQRQHHAKA